MSHLHSEIINAIGDTKDKSLNGRLFLSFTNERGIKELLSLWNQWEEGKPLPYGKTKWRDVFAQTRKIRRWGIEETLDEAHMRARWENLLNSVSTENIRFQIELFYRRNPDKRKK